MIKVLVVDDKADNIYLLQAMLASNGFITYSARNGAEALGLMRNNIPDLIISDILMPVMDGFTLCRECRKDEHLKNIPFFFYTATYVDPKDEEYALSLGADRFILKPQEPDAFLKIIHDFMEEIRQNNIKPKDISQLPETVILKEYNEVLIRKIEDKMVQSEKAERELRRYSEELEKEILERKKNEDSLKKSQHLFQTLAEVSPVGIFRTNPDGNTNYVNPKWSELSGLTFEEASGDDWLNAVHPDDREKVIGNWKLNIVRKTRSDAEYRFLHKDGSIVWVIGNAVPEWINDEINGYIGTITDITTFKKFESDLRYAKDKAEESDRLKSAFLHNISHEVRTPMNAIIGFADLISDPHLETETRNEFIQIIVQASNQLLSIIMQIVSMATIETQQERIYEKTVAVNSVIRTICMQLTSVAGRKNIPIKYSTVLQDGDDRVKTDETKLIQILSNLLSNAIKFTKKGSIDFGYTVKQDFLEFFVKDEGIGIPSEMHETIFQRFRQVEVGMAREYEGSGLGLSIAKAYVELLGGKIWLTSKPGEGSVFYFTLPFSKENPVLLSDHKDAGRNNSEPEKSHKLLIAEDEYNNSFLLQQYFSSENITLVHAVNGTEAVEICRKDSQIDLVLMDLKMPVMDGFEATKKIREFRPGLPIIAQSAYDRDVDKNKAFACGCSDFISKPFNKESILKIVRKHLI